MSLTGSRLDTHLHLWDPALGVYDWLTPDLGLLYATFTAQDAEAELSAAGMHGAVLVQAADSPLDTAAMLDVATSNDWVLGVVGWLDLEDAEGAQESVEQWASSPHLCGVRQLIHDDPRDDVLDLPAVRATLATLATHGIPLDVPDAFPRQLGGALRAAQEVDDLVLVVDHLAKPPRGSEAMSAWESQMREIATHDTVVAKVSGLEIPGAEWSVEALRPVWDIALDSFGPQRLMFGSDWPVSIAGSGYAGLISVLGELISELSLDEQDDVWWRTATRVYGLTPDERGPTPPGAA